MLNLKTFFGGAVAQLGARLDGIEEVVGSNPIGSTKYVPYDSTFTSPRATQPTANNNLLGVKSGGSLNRKGGISSDLILFFCPA